MNAWIVNLILFLAVISFILITVYRYMKMLDENSSEEFDDEELLTFDIETIVTKVNREFIDIENQNLSEYNLTRKELEERKKDQARISTARKKAALGDEDSKKMICALISQFIQLPRIGINTETINEFIHFNNKNQLTSQDKSEILYHIYSKEYGKKGFEQMIFDYSLDELTTINDEECYDITPEKITEIYEKAMVLKNLSYKDKIEIASQRIFEESIGFGGADILFYTNVDEIECGVSGIAKNGYEIHYTESRNIKYSYESIWVVYHGKNLHLSCMQFRNEDSFIRVCQNIYKYEATHVLSKQTGRIVGSMISGNRVVVARPAFANSYVFLARKFDSIKNQKLEELFTDPNVENAILWLKWIVKGQENLSLTGQTGCGKSTALRSIIQYYPSYYAIRVSEMTMELNLNFYYPNRNIISFQETESLSSQDALDFIKKTTGQLCVLSEIATKEQASYFIQISRVASSQGLFTHHGKTASDCVKALAADLVNQGLYTSERDAEKVVAEILNFDCHLENTDGNRHIERITEIIPYEVYTEEFNIVEEQKASEQEEYYRRQNQPLFYTRNIVEWHDGAYYLVNMPTKHSMDSMRRRLTPKERIAFDQDMKTLAACVKENEKDLQEVAL